MIDDKEVVRPDESSSVLLAEAESNPSVRMKIQENILFIV